MNYKSIAASVAMLTLPISSYSAGWITDNVSSIEVANHNGCITLMNGEIVKLDVETGAGKAEFSLALSAKTTNKQLKVYQLDSSLVGGCNTGTTIKPHSVIKLID